MIDSTKEIVDSVDMEDDSCTPNQRVIKSYVFHGDKCFFVSTIERDSSAMLGPRRFNETMVWHYDWSTAERGSLFHQDEAPCGSIRTHNYVCEQLHEDGEIKAND